MKDGVLGPIFVLTAGMWIWAAHFTLLYGVTALSCERGAIDPGSVPTFVILATVIFEGLIVATLFLTARRADTDVWTFTREVGTLISLLAAVAIAWGAVPALIVGVCR